MKIVIFFLVIPAILSVLFGVFGSLFDGYFGTELTGPLFARVLRTIITEFLGVIWAGYLYFVIWFLMRRK
jgi:hypothetical protein